MLLNEFNNKLANLKLNFFYRVASKVNKFSGTDKIKNNTLIFNVGCVLWETDQDTLMQISVFQPFSIHGTSAALMSILQY